jgi:hypothetical protein
MPRQRYRQNPLPLGSDAPPAELFGPEQPNPPGLQKDSPESLSRMRLGRDEGREDPLAVVDES